MKTTTALAVASVLVLALGACGDSDAEPSAADSSETTEPTTESATPTETETSSASTSAPATGPIVLEDGRLDLCSAVSFDQLATETGWTPVESGDYVGEGSCEWEFEEADLSVAYDEYSSVEDLRAQYQHFRLVELPGVGDEAFLQLAAAGLEITPESVGMVIGSGEWVVVGGATENDESISEDELAAATEVLARACAAVL